MHLYTETQLNNYQVIEQCVDFLNAAYYNLFMEQINNPIGY